MNSLLRSWADRTQVERVRMYTLSSLYLLLWLLLLLAGVGAVALVSNPTEAVVAGVLTLLLGVAGTVVMREAIRLYPAPAPVPWRLLGVLVALAVVSEALVFALPEKARFSAAIVVLGALAWGAGGLRDRQINRFLYVAFPVLVLVPTGSAGLAAFGLGMGLFLIFTVQSSLWLLGVVTELERGRNTQAALAVAEERLRFSRDVHDVLGRQLSTIAVQAELAATLAERGDVRAPQHILQVRETAHDALREARELARGYRPLDLEAEIDGAISLLRSAGITATAELDGLPAAWHEPVARVIREAVTNVLRHSVATRVTMQYADGVVAICNDGASATSPRHDMAASDGTGLLGLTEQLAPSGAVVTTEHHGEEFVVRVQLARSERPAQFSVTEQQFSVTEQQFSVTEQGEG
jgi:two-component system sensor histidine kinase DesK